MAWGTATESAYLTVDADFEFFTNSGGTAAIAVALNPRETMSIFFNVAAAGTTDDLEIEVIQGHRIQTGFGLDTGSTSTVLALNTASDPIATNDDLNGTFIVMTSGGEAGEGKLVIDSAATGDTATLENALSGAPSSTETYDRYRASAFRFSMDPQTTLSDDAQNNDGITVRAEDGRYVLVRARSTGATDAHRVILSYQVDGVSI